jgi:hypothetical protein
MTSDVDEISVCTEIIPVQTNSKPVSPVNIVELLNSVGGDRVAAARKLVALWGDVSDANSCGSAMRSSVVDTRSLSSQTLKPKQSTESSILLQARKLAALFIPEEVNGSEHKVKIDEVLEPFDSNSGHTEDVPILNQSNSIDITRIVLANSDEFCENFPWLLKKFSTWVSEYGPSLAYHILNAVPSLWRRSKPESLRRQIKVLYVIICSFIYTYYFV